MKITWKLYLLLGFVALGFNSCGSKAKTTSPQTDGNDQPSLAEPATTNNQTKKLQSDDEVQGGITSIGFVVEEIPEGLREAGILYKRATTTDGESVFEIKNSGDDAITLQPIGETVAAGETRQLDILDGKTRSHSLEVQSDKDGRFLGTIDLTDIPE